MVTAHSASNSPPGLTVIGTGTRHRHRHRHRHAGFVIGTGTRHQGPGHATAYPADSVPRGAAPARSNAPANRHQGGRHVVSRPVLFVAALD